MRVVFYAFLCAKALLAAPVDSHIQEHRENLVYSSLDTPLYKAGIENQGHNGISILPGMGRVYGIVEIDWSAYRVDEDFFFSDSFLKLDLNRLTSLYYALTNSSKMPRAQINLLGLKNIISKLNSKHLTFVYFDKFYSDHSQALLSLLLTMRKYAVKIS